MIHKVTAGDDHAKEIRRLERQLAMAQEIELVDTSALEAKIAELRSAPHEPPKVDLTPSGMTIAQFWDSLKTPDERGKFLGDHGARPQAQDDPVRVGTQDRRAEGTRPLRLRCAKRSGVARRPVGEYIAARPHGIVQRVLQP